MDTGSLSASDVFALTVATGFNEIVGTSGDDTLTGSTGHDHIQGLGGNDSIDAREGNDIVEGGDGNDQLNAATGAIRSTAAQATTTWMPGRWPGSETTTLSWVGRQRVLSGRQGTIIFMAGRATT